MTGSFHVRDYSRKRVFSLLGLGFLIVSSVSLLSATRPSDILPFQFSTATAPSPGFKSFHQADDLFHGEQNLTHSQNVGPTDTSAWPALSHEQVEQARVTLIRQGFSPMQADMVLPAANTP